MDWHCCLVEAFVVVFAVVAGSADIAVYKIVASEQCLAVVAYD